MFYYQRAVPIGRTRSSQCSPFAIETLSHNTLTILIHPSLLPLRTRLTARISRCIFLCSNALLYAYSSFCVMQIWSLDSHSVSMTINIIAANWNVHDGVVGMVHPIYIFTPQTTVKREILIRNETTNRFFSTHVFIVQEQDTSLKLFQTPFGQCEIPENEYFPHVSKSFTHTILLVPL